jgi:c(7)-type cytochrome triheme protein
MQKIEQGDQCGACHDGRKAFGSSGNCNRCHRPAENH